MLGLIRKTIERFDLNKYPHTYPADMYGTDPETGHLNRYLDINKGYFTLYDLAVYIIVGTFMLAFIYLVCKEIKEQEKAYMFVCVTIIGICALLF